MGSLAVIPIVIGPLQVLLALLPALLMALGSLLLALFKPRTIKQILKFLWRIKLSILFVSLAVGSGAYGLRTLISGNAPTTSRPATGSWPTFRGNLSRTGSLTGTPSPFGGDVHWSFTSGSKTIYASPAVVGNMVYITTADIGVLTNRGAIVCLDKETGRVIWEAAPPKYRATFSSPAVDGKYLVVGEGLHFVRDGRVVCLDVEQNGKVLWTYQTKSHVESSPAIAEGRVVIGAGDDGYYCFELEPDAQGHAVVAWHLSGDQYPDAEASPAIHEGKVYLALGWGGHALVCVDLKTGRELWRTSAPAPVFTAPTISNGLVIFGCGYGDFVHAEEQAIAQYLKRLKDRGLSEKELDSIRQQTTLNGEVIAVDLTSGNIVWRFRTERSVLASIAADSERLICADRAGNLYALAYDGRLLAKQQAGAPVIASPAITERYIYILDFRGRLLALNKETLQPVWETSVSRADGHVSSPVIADGRVYVGSIGRGLVCLGQPLHVDRPRWVRGDSDGTPLEERGAMVWRWPPPSEAPLSPPKVTGLWVAGDRLFAYLVEADRSGLATFDITSKPLMPPTLLSFLETSRRPVGFLSDGQPVFSSRYSADDASMDGPYCVRINTLNELVCADRETDIPLWTFALPAPTFLPPLVHGKRVFLAYTSNIEARRLVDGTLLWTFDCPEPRQLSTGSDTLAVITASGEMYILSAETGVRWHRLAGANPSVRPLIHGDTLLYASQDAWVKFKLGEGTSETWMKTGWLGAITAGPVVAQSSVYFATDKYGIVKAGRR